MTTTTNTCVNLTTPKLFFLEWHEDGGVGKRAFSGRDLIDLNPRLGAFQVVTFERDGLRGAIGGGRAIEIEWSAGGAARSEFFVDQMPIAEAVALALAAINHAAMVGVDSDGFSPFPVTEQV